jgi:hypothetical protein
MWSALSFLANMWLWLKVSVPLCTKTTNPACGCYWFKSHRILVDPYMFGKRWKRCSKILDSNNVTTFICLVGWVHYMHRERDQYLCKERSRVGVNRFTYQQHAGAWDFSAMWASKPTGQTYKKQYHQWNCSLIDSMPNREENIKTCNGVSQIVHLDCYTQDLPGSLVLMCLKML